MDWPKTGHTEVRRVVEGRCFDEDFEVNWCNDKPNEVQEYIVQLLRIFVLIETKTIAVGAGTATIGPLVAGLAEASQRAMSGSRTILAPILPLLPPLGSPNVPRAR